MNSYVFFLVTLAYVSASTISSYPTARHGPVGYHGPLAIPVVLNDGHIADTPEVAAVRHAQYVALANAAARSGGYGSDYYGHGGSYGYGGHGVYSYGPGTGNIYRGQYGYAGLHSAPYGHGYSHGPYIYGPRTSYVYTGEYGYPGLPYYGHGYGHHL